MARRLGPAGRSLGVDISAPLVAAARARAAAEGLANAAFVEADAQAHAFEAQGFDAVISRFGVMFFDDPEAAFANIRRGAVDGGRLTFVAWRSPEENSFMTAAAAAAAPIVGPPTAPQPDAPGQFAFADRARIARILAAAGWRDVEIRPIDERCAVEEADLMAYALRLGPVGLALREADAATRERAADLLRGAFAPFVAEGVARFEAACWLVTAKA
jgi:SAM-dependent methyltransferase